MYRAINSLCCVDLRELNLSLTDDQAVSILLSKGFRRVNPDIVTIARSVVGKTYRRGARLYEAPEVFDCSSLTKWLYGQVGIWLPRRAIQQRELGKVVGLSELQPGDLVFGSGWIDRYLEDPSDGVGHVGIATSCATVVHAANKKVGVIESSIDEFVEPKKLRGVRRIVDFPACYFFVLPEEREIETSDDIKWVILESLPRSS